MAPPIAILRSSRGSALIESIPVIAVLLTFTSGLLLAAYFLFAQIWIGYQSEQALYCVAEGRHAAQCERQLKMDIQAALPWGRFESHVQAWRSQWRVEVIWRYKDYQIKFTKELNPKLAMGKRDLRW